ncbi:MAG: DUF4349 domain-containing protein [Intrasporangium sp.]|uniref:DUF4349 domain-containing protein n=1 Tax=Intrasporangium sp. TaxID=1925024 RepID=UPI002648BF46|nr:DUF4349 domain-containing protein [Intrasporangium sp.]MDN5794508.1 DUF4349 domain-containing protein [Intrasporangium sp.]
MTAVTGGRPKGWFHRRWVWALAVLLLLVVAFPVGLQFRPGVTSGAASDSSASPPAQPGAGLPADELARIGAGSPEVPDAGQSPAPGTAPARDAAGSGAAAGTPVVGPKIARSAWLGIQVSDLVGASGTVRSLTAAAGGQVLSESVVTAPDPTGGPQPGLGVEASMPRVGVDQAQITVRVPADKLDGLVNGLSRIGTVSYRSSQSEDLTDGYVDVTARIGPLRDAVAQARALLAKATSLSQIIALENEVTRRQAELDSLQSRLATLERRTTTSDVTVSLWTGATPVATSGFMAQLRQAWTGLLDSVTVLLTGVAMLLPWLLVLLVAVLLGRRWWTRRGSGSGPARPAANPTD